MSARLAKSVFAETAHVTERLTIDSIDSDSGEWDRFVETARDSTFCHLAAWRAIMADALGHESTYLTVRDDRGAIAGVLPLVHVSSRVFGHYVVSLPFLNYGGPIGSASAQTELARAARRLAADTAASLLELRARHAFESDLTTRSRKVTVLLELGGSSDELFRRRFPAKLRSQIRRPSKEGFIYRSGTTHMSGFYQVFTRHMRDLGTPVLPYAFFEAMPTAFQRELVVAAVYDGTRPVAAGVGFIWRNEFEITWASARRDYSSRAPNMLLYWGLMEEMIERRVARFNFGRCTSGSGTHRFKSQWGGESVALPWRVWSPRGDVMPASPDQPMFKVATRIWQRCPLTVANWLGPLLARSLP